MENSGCLWDNEEDEQLIKLYSKYKMDISEIAKIHKRSILAIEKRLEKLGLKNNIENSVENFVFYKAIDVEKRMRNNNIHCGNKNEIICKAVSEIINDKSKEFNKKIKELNDKSEEFNKKIKELSDKIEYLQLYSLN